MFETILEIRDTILRNKMRTIATGVAVASGLFLLIVLLGAGNGVIHTMEQNSQNLALDMVEVSGWRTSVPYKGHPANRRIQLDQKDAEHIGNVFAGNIVSVNPEVTQWGVYATVGKNTAKCNLCGAYSTYLASKGKRLVEGRFINNKDVDELRKVAVIDQKMERILFERTGIAMGKNLRIAGMNYVVVGVMEENTESSELTVCVPYSTLAHIYNKTTAIDQVVIKSKNLDTEAKAEDFSKQLRRSMAHAHEFDENDSRGVWVHNSASESQTMSKAFSMISLSFWILGMLTLLSGVVGVSNIMLITVKERTHEFGIRKALGARPWEIIRMVILESIAITTVFGYVGMFLGILFCQYMDSNMANQTLDMGIAQMQYFIDPTVDLGTCLKATLLMIVAGAVAGFFPAWRAARVKPIEALRG